MTLSSALVGVSLMLLAGCATKPPPAGISTSNVPTSTYPLHIAGDSSIEATAVMRVGIAYQLTVTRGRESSVVARANVPVLLPTLVAPDALGYFELDGRYNRFFVQDLASGRRRGAGYGDSPEVACTSELRAARNALGENLSLSWSDAQASRGAEGACRAAFVRAWIRMRFDDAQGMLRERRFAEAKAALLAFVEAYPNDDAVAKAYFSAGAADFASRNYRSAAELFRKSAAAPTVSPSLAAEALLAAADCALEIGSAGQSFGDLAKLVRSYPLTAAASIARERMAYEKKPFAFKDEVQDIEKGRYAIEPWMAYPAMSRRLGEQGTVLVGVIIETDGSPREVALVASSGYQRLDEAALASVRRAYFFPARSPSGKKVPVRMTVPIRFRLES